MSLYLGKDNTNKNKLVISKTVMTKDEMKASTVLDGNIIFNSSLPYFNVTYVKSKTIALGYGTNGTSRTHTYTYTADEVSLIDNAGDRRHFMVSLDGIHVPCYGGTLSDYGGAVGLWSYAITSTSVIVYTPTSYTGSVIELVIMPFTVNGNTLFTQLYGGVIDISNNDFTINNVSIFKTQFLTTSTVNTVDKVVDLYRQSYQIVNSSTPLSSEIILSSNKDSTTVLYGNKVVLSSTVNYIPLLVNSVVHSKTYTNYYEDTPLTGFSFNSGSLYYIKVKSTATMVVGHPVSYKYFIGRADDVANNNNLFIVPSYVSGMCIGVYTITISTTSITPTWTIVFCQGGAGPSWNVYKGPYDVEVSYIQLT